MTSLSKVKIGRPVSLLVHERTARLDASDLALILLSEELVALSSASHACSTFAASRGNLVEHEWTTAHIEEGIGGALDRSPHSLAFWESPRTCMRHS